MMAENLIFHNTLFRRNIQKTKQKHQAQSSIQGSLLAKHSRCVPAILINNQVRHLLLLHRFERLGMQSVKKIYTYRK
ncbi:MAG: hypothetical protein CSA33_08935 [Desulfobulbus propionicus]|nr:MAG: hypothetical protein CSA33_08935 [Desulfobulbus propionicus]